MINIGITGQTGFIGSHLCNTLSLNKEKYRLVEFPPGGFESQYILRQFVSQCDVIVHLAAMNRHENTKVIYETNVRLVEELIKALEAECATPIVIFSSSTQEGSGNDYGLSKKKGGELFKAWAESNKADVGHFVIPNVFGPFCKPNYNSFIATFCHQLIKDEKPKVIQDSTVELVYVDNLCEQVVGYIDSTVGNSRRERSLENINVVADFSSPVSSILSQLEVFKHEYFVQGFIPKVSDRNIVNLFNTFRSYIDHSSYFPRALTKHKDNRGSFVETIRLSNGGQVSFSTTVPGVTRGDHYHTRKIERFTVIRGKALIQLRKIGTDDVLNFELDGETPGYVDMPIWYTHNITNIGDKDLYTQFWINEWYNPDDADTYFEKVEL